ncbi:MAG: DUF2461 domain-containing protein [Acidobacteriota bacterium]
MVFFTPRTLSFLRALERNNRREWFLERREQYNLEVRAPMVALIERLAAEFDGFAPDLVASPRVSIYRVYRDTRFSPDKTPLKTHVAAHFPHRRLPKNECAGLYVEIAPRHVWFGGGMYMPSTSQLQLVREHLATRHRRLRRIIDSPAFRRAVGSLEGERLSRVPRGFPRDHPAADLLRYRQFLAGREEQAAFAHSPAFFRSLVTVFRAIAPLVAFLNEPLVAARAAGVLGHDWLERET